MALLAAGVLHPDRDPARDPLENPPSDAMAALQFMTLQRAYPEPDIPAARYMQEFEAIAPTLHRAGRRTAGADIGGHPEPDPWTALGPKNVGGRTISLAVNPKNTEIIWAGAASGGLWRTDTGGIGSRAWHYIETGFPVLGVNAIAIDPGDTSVVYAGTGEVYNRDDSMGSIYIRTTRGSYGIGILKTTDGGVTWTKSLDWSYDQRRGVLDIVIDPFDTSRIWAGTSDGLYRSIDDGASWQNVLDVDMAVDVAVDPVHSDTLYVSCGNLDTPSGQIGIYRSFNGGDTWTQLNLGGSGLPATWTGKTLLDIYQSAPNVLYADVANMFSDEDWTGVGLYRSLDYGDTWELLTNNIKGDGGCCYDALDDNGDGNPYHGYNEIAKYQGWFSHFVIVHPADSSKVVVSGVDTYKSTDGGRTFTRKSVWWHWNYGVSTPAGGEEGPADYSHGDHHNFARHPTAPNTIFLGTDGGVFKSETFAESFRSYNGGYQTTQFYAGFSSHRLTPDLAIGGLQDNSTVLYEGTPDWKRIFGGDGAATTLHATDTDYIIGESQRGRIYRSLNRGDSYYNTNRDMYGHGDPVCFVAPLGQAPSNPGVIYGGRTQVWRTTNYAQTWGLAPGAAALSGAPVVAISVYPRNQDILWATTVPDPPIEAGVFRSTDGARTWTDVTHDLPDRYPMDIAAAWWDPAVAYVVFSGFGTSHLFKTEDAGATWIDLDGGTLPDIPTSAFAIDPYKREFLYLGNDFGVWFSPDDGQSWYEFSAGMPTGALIMDLSVSPSNWSLRAVTHGNGIWERTLMSAAAAVNDSIAPSFIFAPVRSSVLRAYYDLYFVPSEILPALPTARVDTTGLTLDAISTVGGNIYVADWELEATGDFTVSIAASDFAGNDSTSTFLVATQLVSARAGGALILPGGEASLSIEPGAVGRDEYLLGTRVDEAALAWLSGAEGASRMVGRGAESGAATEEDRILRIWSVQPADLQLTVPARLTVGWTLDDLAGADPAALTLCRREGDQWVPLESWVDPERGTIEATLDRLGIVALLVGEAGGETVLGWGLDQNYPNPFNGSTTIRYSLPQTAQVELFILNVRGQRVRTLVAGSAGPGRHAVRWDGRSDAGREVATGVYLVMLRTAGRTFTRKALYIR